VRRFAIMTAPLHRICVFAGSNVGHQLAYAQAAELLGRTLAQQKIGLVYGGGGVGLMGKLADAALAGGGEVIGVIPEALHRREVGHTRLTALHIVDSMHQRKAMMASYADAFVVLPGGLGTLEETFEVWTWGQLGLHHKPIGLLDVDGFWQPMIAMLERMVDEGFVQPQHRQMVCIDKQAPELLEQLRAWQPIEQPAVLESSET
jgi:uncharacterized protein (TIGR00730 family)